MKTILITGACGFVGRSLAKNFRRDFSTDELRIIGIDNLSRPGSSVNVANHRKDGIEFLHADIRVQSDLEQLPECDWIVDAAANPSVLAGVNGQNGSRALVETNLFGTVNLLELCRRWKAGFVLLSTSRVYSCEALNALPLKVLDSGFHFVDDPSNRGDVSPQGVSESFSSATPISLYGSTKLASEQLAAEYALAFDFPIWINRCGVLAGAGQFGRADQGIFSYWLHSWLAQAPLKYLGFGGEGNQLRDCLHPSDLYSLVRKQMNTTRTEAHAQVYNVSGGIESAMSLAQLSAWCRNRWGDHPVGADQATRRFDVPWLVLDSRRCRADFDWSTEISIHSILDEIAVFAEDNREWLQHSQH